LKGGDPHKISRHGKRAASEKAEKLLFFVPVFTVISQPALGFLTVNESRITTASDKSSPPELPGSHARGNRGWKKAKEIMSTKTNLILDLTMFGAFLAASNPHLTGVSIHEWLALSLAGAIVTHLLFHWTWIVQVGAQFFRKLWRQSRLNFVVNSLFFIAMTGTIFSGLMISQSVLATLGIQLDVSRSWKSIHTLMSDASVILLGVHFALHLKWVAANVGRYIIDPVRDLFQRRALPQVLTAQPVPVEKANRSRRGGPN
jgi:hypothetical protein